jgi:membrane associated rhomboid family serine protease
MIAQHIHPASGVFLWLSHIHLIASGEWLSVLAGLLAAALVFFAFARILGFRFNPLEFILYYFVYSPVWMATNVVMFFLVIFRIRISIDWKISGG